MATETEIIRVIEDVACVSKAQLNDTLEDDLDLDSLDLVELVMELERSFDIEITDEQAEEARTVKDVVERVFELVHSGGAI